MPKHPRHAAPPQATETAVGTSLLEVALYGVLGAVVAAGVLLVGGQPIWQAIVIVGIALVLLVAAIMTTRRDQAHAVASSTASRHGRRRPR